MSQSFYCFLGGLYVSLHTLITVSHRCGKVRAMTALRMQWVCSDPTGAGQGPRPLPCARGGAQGGRRHSFAASAGGSGNARKQKSL
jgi:hypothetical protein